MTKHAWRQTGNLSETRGKKADYTKKCSGLGVRVMTVSHATPSRAGVQHFMPSQSPLPRLSFWPLFPTPVFSVPALPELSLVIQTLPGFMKNPFPNTVLG